MNLTFRQLRIFTTVAEGASINSAAAVFHLTPPAVSMQIKEIESQVGLALFVRKKRRLSLSPAGKLFLMHAKHLLASVKGAENDMAHLKHLGEGLLTVGIVTTPEYFVPRLLTRFRDAHPSVEVRIRVANTQEQLAAMLDAAEIDLAVIARPPKGIGARAEKFADNPLVFVCSPEHPILRRTSVPVQALDGCPLIAREKGVGTRVAMDDFLATHRCKPKITMEISSNETIKQCVIAGMGFGFLPLHCIGSELLNRQLGVPNIKGSPLMLAWNLVYIPSRALSPAAEAFREFMADQGQKFLQANDASLLSLAFRRNASQKVQRIIKVAGR